MTVSKAPGTSDDDVELRSGFLQHVSTFGGCSLDSSTTGMTLGLMHSGTVGLQHTNTTTSRHLNNTLLMLATG